MFYTYILLSLKDHRFYVGYTGDLKKRFEEHNQGKCDATRPRRPLELFYYEAFLDETDAVKKEKYYKTGSGRKYLQRHLKNSIKKVKAEMEK